MSISFIGPEAGSQTDYNYDTYNRKVPYSTKIVNNKYTAGVPHELEDLPDYLAQASDEHEQLGMGNITGGVPTLARAIQTHLSLYTESSLTFDQWLRRPEIASTEVGKAMLKSKLRNEINTKTSENFTIFVPVSMDTQLNEITPFYHSDIKYKSVFDLPDTCSWSGALAPDTWIRFFEKIVVSKNGYEIPSFGDFVTDQTQNMPLTAHTAFKMYQKILWDNYDLEGMYYDSLNLRYKDLPPIIRQEMKQIDKASLVSWRGAYMQRIGQFPPESTAKEWLRQLNVNTGGEFIRDRDQGNEYFKHIRLFKTIVTFVPFEPPSPVYSIDKGRITVYFVEHEMLDIQRLYD